MDNEDIRLNCLQLAVNMLLSGRLASKTTADVVNTADFFSEFVMNGVEEDDEEEPEKKHGADLATLSEDR